MRTIWRSLDGPILMNFRSPRRRCKERGYILLTLMLFVALLTIGLLALVQNIETQIKRDREEELIHRGVQYARAVKHFYIKFGRYPNSIADLENTNNYRSLRKRYKDPLNRDPATGKERDFKLLHMTDVQMSFAGGGPGALPPGVGPNGPAAGGLNGVTPAPDASGQDPTVSQNPQAGDQSGATDAAGQSGRSAAQSVQPGNAQSVESGLGGAQVFGGGGIVGVASASKDKTIREFNKKDHYNQWQFIYDPTSNKGGLLMTPNQPPLTGSVQTVAPGTNGSQPPPGQNPPGMGPSQPGPGGPQQPNPQPLDQ
jgi:type II secretory pathway pseudopilin PulG